MKTLLAFLLALIATPALAVVPSFMISDTTVAENAGKAVLTITKSAPAKSYSKITVATYAGTATAGSDYQPVNVTLTFSNSQLSQTVSIPIINDSVVEGTEQFAVKITAVRNASIAKAIGTVNIIDDDAPPPTPVVWTKCANEGQDCNIVGTANVRFGSGTSWTQRAVTAGAPCTVAFFGDPGGVSGARECDTDGSIPSPVPIPPTNNPCLDYSGTTPLGPVPGSNCPARFCPGYPYPVDVSQPCPAPTPTPTPPMAPDGVAVVARTPCGYTLPDPTIPTHSDVGTWWKGQWVPLSCGSP